MLVLRELSLIILQQLTIISSKLLCNIFEPHFLIFGMIIIIPVWVCFLSNEMIYVKCAQLMLVYSKNYKILKMFFEATVSVQ